MKQTRIELVISSSTLLISTLNNYHDNKFEELEDLEYTIFPKIDLLIVDDFIKFRSLNIAIHKIKTIINLSNILIRNDEIRLSKPFNLANLVNIVNYHRSNNSIFLNLTKNWIYDNQFRKIYNEYKKIKLTEKENEIFNYLLLNKNSQVAKKDLITQFKYWNDYYIDIHLYRLKSKLPDGFIIIHQDFYQLNTD